MRISKERKIELFVFALAIIFILTSFITFRGFHAKFYNKTGEDIDSLIIAGTLIGELRNNNSTEKISFKSFEFDSSYPYDEISGIIKNKKLDQLNWSWCGTERYTESKGSYSFDIRKAVDEKGNDCLYLVEHNKKAFFEGE
ncbi:hypothetical protein EV144_102308 [Flavobacterium sp. 270]|uniref:hypothetical protein n=1 Tax=Flavobacterium sp. 270 TaxID=2512114 RepID=UPI001066319F|nr:hypothetical protein [Flavobacterium sp. 270]TDW49880.1 hypothetical protein EV144_102308 [Flavobacterium sp. 270]